MTAPAPPQGQFKGLINKDRHRFTHFIAAGGEGRVFHLNSRGPSGEPLAGKVYGNDLTRSKIRKLSQMIALGTAEVRAVSAWPIDILATHGNQVVGFAMPFISGGTPLHQLRTPKSRLANMPNLSYRQLVLVAENVAGAVASLHQANVVIGDINGQNFLVQANGTVQAIDCDSMQVGTKREWASGVGVEEYIAPELQRRSLKGVIRTPNHDAFALAVLLFELLVLGRHPFGGHANLTIAEAIAKRAHLFSRNKPQPTVFDVAALKPTDLLSNELIHHFKTAFGSSSRPSASDWHDVLQRYRKQLQPCRKNGNHAYPPSTNHCPWCKMEKKKLPKLFNQKALPSQRTWRVFHQRKPQTSNRSGAAAGFSLVHAPLALFSWALQLIFQLTWWFSKFVLKILLTPVSTTRAISIKLIQAAISYIWLLTQSLAQLIVQMATIVGHILMVVATIVWKGICVLATILFNIGLMLGTLYAALWILREFIRSIFF